MRNLVLLLIIVTSYSTFANIPCDRVARLVRIGNESMSIMRNRGFSDLIKSRIRRTIDDGTEVDPGFLQTAVAGRQVANGNRFGPRRRMNGTENLADHFDKHRMEFNPPIQTPNEYLRRARRFLASTSENTISVRRSGSGTVKYNPSTREFAAVDPNGNIKTFFRADLDYINRTNPSGPFRSLTEWFYRTQWEQQI